MQTAVMAPARADLHLVCLWCGRPVALENAQCPHCGKRRERTEIWLFRPLVIVLLSFFPLGPLAIPLARRTPYLSPRGRTILTWFIAIDFALQMVAAAWLTTIVFRYFYQMSAQLQGIG